jgi:hypothetical protein
MTFRTLCALAAAAFIGTTTMSMAATLTSTGATGVDVDGTLYDVAFVDGSCISVFTGCNSPSDFFFTNRFSAGDAAQALLDLFNAPGNEQFTISPNLISGCAASAVCSVLTPYDGFIFFNEPNVSVATFENNDVSSGQFANNIPDGTYRETFLMRPLTPQTTRRSMPSGPMQPSCPCPFRQAHFFSSPGLVGWL